MLNDMANQKTQVMVRVMKEMFHSSRWIIPILGLSLLQVGLTLYVPVAIGQFIDIVGSGQAIDWEAIKQLIYILGVIIAVNSFIQWGLPKIIHQTIFNYGQKLRQDVMQKIHYLPMATIDQYSSGQLVSRLIQDIDQLSDGLLLLFNQFLTGILTIVFAIITMGQMDRLMMVLVIALSPLSLLVARTLARNSFQFFREQAELRSQHLNFVEEMIYQLKMVRLMQAQDRVNSHFREINEAYLRKSQQAIFISSVTHPVTRFINALIYAFMILLGIWRISNLQMTVGALVTFLNFVTQYTKPFNDISSVMSEIQGASASAHRVFEVLDSCERQEERMGLLDQVKGNVEFDQVDFSYLPGQPLIQNFNLSVKAGQKIAIVGPTGAGKSTLINLLMRFYEVDTGTILLDDRPINLISLQAYRQQFGMVLQESWLKRGTIHENIAFGNPRATRDQVIKAAEAAHAHHFIEQLPNGYDTVLDDGGNTLSIGQQQLLAIARLFIKLPNILILDEATSSIDTRTEMMIQNAFAKLMDHRTTFIIAHRLSTIQNADLILVMNHGQIIEQGTHAELMKRRDFYYNLQTVNLLD